MGQLINTINPNTRKFAFWVNSVLPTVYSESLSYYEALSKLNFVVEEHENDIVALAADVKLINDSISKDDTTLDDLEKRVGVLETDSTTLKNQVNVQMITIQELQAEMRTFREEMEKIKNGDYVSLYLDSIINYLDEHINDMIGRSVNYVIFGLTPNGHFCALIPTNWNWISFDTILEAKNDLYGHLVMRY